jgi:hypothetical protein
MGSIGNFMSDAGHFFANTGKFIAKMATGVYDAATSLPSDIETVWDHPGDLKAWSKLAGDLGTVAGAVALAAAIVVCPLDAVGLEGAAAALGAGGEVVADAGLAMGVAKTGFDSGLAAEGEGSWSTVALDGGSLVLSQAKIPGLTAAKADTSGLEGQAGALETYVAGREGGQTASQAYSALSADQKVAIKAATDGLSGSHGLNYVQSSVSSSLAAAKTLERRLNAGNEAVHLGVDRAKDVALPDKDGGTDG